MSVVFVVNFLSENVERYVNHSGFFQLSFPTVLYKLASKSFLGKIVSRHRAPYLQNERVIGKLT